MQAYEYIAGGLSSVKGFKTVGIHCGLKKQSRDLAIILADGSTSAAGVFTLNKAKAAPVIVSQENLKHSQGYCKGVVINSGNANACTGKKGLENANKMTEAAAKLLGITPEELLVASTGVIGVQLPMEMVLQGISQAVQGLDYSNSAAAAEAIMTTDTYPKEAAVETLIGGKRVTLAGIAKGSGMIHPNMATMLAFITTDCSISSAMLHQALLEATQGTFNMISVDGDTSTNDTVLAFANAEAKNELIDTKNSEYLVFKEALTALCSKLSELIVRDGEGATKFVSVEVVNAPTVEDARKAARGVTTSALVKTAVFGEDANWGRVIMAVGNSGASFDPNRVAIYLESAGGKEQMMADGMGLAFDEDKAKRILAKKDITFKVDFNLGKASATAWTCDFSYDYVKINADYRS